QRADCPQLLQFPFRLLGRGGEGPGARRRDRQCRAADAGRGHRERKAEGVRGFVPFFVAALCSSVLVGCGEAEQSGLWKLPHGEERAEFRGAARFYLGPHDGCFGQPEGIDEGERIAVLKDRIASTILKNDLAIVLDDLTLASRIPATCIPTHESAEEREKERLRAQKELDREWEPLDRA